MSFVSGIAYSASRHIAAERSSSAACATKSPYNLDRFVSSASMIATASPADAVSLQISQNSAMPA